MLLNKNYWLLLSFAVTGSSLGQSDHTASTELREQKFSNLVLKDLSLLKIKH